MPDGEGRGCRFEAVREAVDELVVVKRSNLVMTDRCQQPSAPLEARAAALPWATSYQRGVDEAVRGGLPGLRRDQAVEGELLLRAVNWGDVVGGVALLGIRVHLHRPVTVLWHESVDGDGLGLYPGLGGGRRAPLVS